jgi:hypothetical protein
MKSADGHDLHIMCLFYVVHSVDTHITNLETLCWVAALVLYGIPALQNLLADRGVNEKIRFIWRNRR